MVASFPQPSQLIGQPVSAHRPARASAMDASTPAAAVPLAQAAATEEVLRRERERAAMANEDTRSYVAQRHFVGSVQVPQARPIMTWEALYDLRHEDMHLAHDAMRAARRFLRAGNNAAAQRVLEAELGSDEEEEEAEEEEEEEEAEVELSAEPFSGTARRLDPPAFVPFSGTGHRIA